MAQPELNCGRTGVQSPWPGGELVRGWNLPGQQPASLLRDLVGVAVRGKSGCWLHGAPQQAMAILPAPSLVETRLVTSLAMETQEMLLRTIAKSSSRSTSGPHL